jgi:hypothetical protein
MNVGKDIMNKALCGEGEGKLEKLMTWLSIIHGW